MGLLKRSARVAPDDGADAPSAGGAPPKPAPAQRRGRAATCAAILCAGCGKKKKANAPSRRVPAPPPPSEQVLIMLGCDNAGKSTLIAGMVGRPVESTIPTVGFDRATMVFNHTNKAG